MNFGSWKTLQAGVVCGAGFTAILQRVPPNSCDGLEMRRIASVAQMENQAPAPGK
jgi:hypothetical protein